MRCKRTKLESKSQLLQLHITEAIRCKRTKLESKSQLIISGSKVYKRCKRTKLKYPSTQTVTVGSKKMMTVKIRYKQPESNESKLLVYPVVNSNESWEQSSNNFRFSSAVAEFGLLLRSSAYKQTGSYRQVIKMASGAAGQDVNG